MIANGVYLAGRYSRKNELRECAKELEACGWFVTSSWLKEPHNPNAQLKEFDDQALRELAEADLDDIRQAATMVFFAEPQDVQPPRGGRHVEFGYALAHDLRLVVIGAKENIFHFLSDVTVYPTWKDFVLGEVFG